MTAASSSPVVARLLLPDDANPAGNVHGGTILKLMEEAGGISARRFLVANNNKQNETPSLASCVAALVRFENMSFHQPVYVGEVASVSAHVVFTSPHSVLVKVVVTAENLCDGGETRMTNSGELWYLPLVAGEDDTWKYPRVAQAPQLPIPTDGVALQEYNRGKQSYNARIRGQSLVQECMTTPECPSMEAFRSEYSVSDGHTPADSHQELCQMTLPGDCSSSGFAYGGFIMKLMDNAAGCSAFRHCRTNVVTVAISAMDFVSWIRLGDVCSIQSQVVFASKKTLEIEVAAFDTSVGTEENTLVAKGMFIFASLNEEGKAIPVPPLKLETEADFEKAYLGKLRYDAAKRAREAATATTRKSAKGLRTFSTSAIGSQCKRTFYTVAATRNTEATVAKIRFVPISQRAIRTCNNSFLLRNDASRLLLKAVRRTFR